jgi:2-iminobutanoate/2-iminopropanoate deaminase
VAKQIVSTPEAPAAVGPYSQAVKANGLVFCSGQIPLSPETGELAGDSITAQTEQCLKNLSAVLAAAGTSTAEIVKVTAYLVDMGDFPEFNSVYERFFDDEPPARATVGVAALPKAARVEVECVALA